MVGRSGAAPIPLTELQRDLLAVLARNRSEESHFAGGVVLHATPDSARFSRDFDIFHDAAEAVARASDLDVVSLRRAGFEVETTSAHGEWQRPATFRRAVVRHGGAAVEIDWAADSAVRFFPIERDALLGWRLHLFDIATNKALALAARTETRDYVDIVELHRVFPLAAICWAACGKDPGYTPLSLLKMMQRFGRVDPVELEKMKARPLDPVALKTAWISMVDEATRKMTEVADRSPNLPIGVAFVDPSGRPGWIGDDPSLRIHPWSIGGCWPVVRGIPT